MSIRIKETHHNRSTVKMRLYYSGDKLHRTDGPAEEWFYPKIPTEIITTPVPLHRTPYKCSVVPSLPDR